MPAYGITWCAPGRGSHEGRRIATRYPKFLTTSGMATHPLNAVNRGDCIGDDLPSLQALNDERIGPSFAKNETFGRRRESEPDPLKPPFAKDEEQSAPAFKRRWGIRDASEGNASQVHYEGTIAPPATSGGVKATLRRTTAIRRRSS